MKEEETEQTGERGKKADRVTERTTGGEERSTEGGKEGGGQWTSAAPQAAQGGDAPPPRACFKGTCFSFSSAMIEICSVDK